MAIGREDPVGIRQVIVIELPFLQMTTQQRMGILELMRKREQHPCETGSHVLTGSNSTTTPSQTNRQKWVGPPSVLIP